MSAAASRPQENARVFISTAAPLSSMALRIASSDSGINPFWKAEPSMNALGGAMVVAEERGSDSCGVDDIEMFVADRGNANRAFSMAPTSKSMSGVDDEARGRLQVVIRN